MGLWLNRVMLNRLIRHKAELALLGFASAGTRESIFRFDRSLLGHTGKPTH